LKIEFVPAGGATPTKPAVAAASAADDTAEHVLRTSSGVSVHLSIPLSPDSEQISEPSSWIIKDENIKRSILNNERTGQSRVIIPFEAYKNSQHAFISKEQFVDAICRSPILSDALVRFSASQSGVTIVANGEDHIPDRHFEEIPAVVYVPPVLRATAANVAAFGIPRDNSPESIAKAAAECLSVPRTVRVTDIHQANIMLRKNSEVSLPTVYFSSTSVARLLKDCYDPGSQVSLQHRVTQILNAPDIPDHIKLECLTHLRHCPPSGGNALNSQMHLTSGSHNIHLQGQDSLLTALLKTDRAIQTLARIHDNQRGIIRQSLSPNDLLQQPKTSAWHGLKIFGNDGSFAPLATEIDHSAPQLMTGATSGGVGNLMRVQATLSTATLAPPKDYASFDAGSARRAASSAVDEPQPATPIASPRRAGPADSVAAENVAVLEAAASGKQDGFCILMVFIPDQETVAARHEANERLIAAFRSGANGNRPDVASAIDPYEERALILEANALQEEGNWVPLNPRLPLSYYKEKLFDTLPGPLRLKVVRLDADLISSCPTVKAFLGATTNLPTQRSLDYALATVRSGVNSSTAAQNFQTALVMATSSATRSTTSSSSSANAQMVRRLEARMKLVERERLAQIEERRKLQEDERRRRVQV